MKKIIFSENLKKEIAQGTTFLFLFLFVGFLAYDKNIRPEKDLTLTSSIIPLNNFNYDCLDVWIASKNEVKEVFVNSDIFKVKSFTIDNMRAIQVIKSDNPKQIGEEILLIEKFNNSWQREIGPATKEDIEMMSELRKKIN